MHTFRQIQRSVQAQGLDILAAFHVDPRDAVPPLTGDKPARTLLLAGNAGSTLWEAFSCAPEHTDGRPDALDRWSARVAKTLAWACGGQALFPFGGPPHHPFLSWARRGGVCVGSPLGLSLHPRYGLWHAYRFALSLPEKLPDLPRKDLEASRQTLDCRSCAERPCLKACPIGAFTGSDYRHRECARFLADHPQADCNRFGCGSRHACPVGWEYRYAPAHACFHMGLFVAAHAGGGGGGETISPAPLSRRGRVGVG